jgi:plasmid stabilization system protein ParE
LKATIRVSPRAGRQIRQAAKWWRENRLTAPAMLSDEIASAFELIIDMPFAGEPVIHPRIEGLRRILLGRTRYHLYYVALGDRSAVEVIALWHTKRGAAPPL